MIEGLVTALTLLIGLALGLFVLSVYLKDQSIMDVAYGLCFIALAWTVSYRLQAFEVPMLIMLTLVTLWGLRLAIRIYRKNKGKPEDIRYKRLRDKWSMRGHAQFLFSSLVNVFFLQALIIFIVSLPALFLAGMNPAVLTPISYIGLALWIFGFIYESTADAQLDAFMRARTDRDSIMDKGLFRYSRRPNYFGESMMWWGLAFFAAPMLPVPYIFVVFTSPFLITYIVTSVTGPMLERGWENNPRYQAYKKKTSYFIPLPPQRV